MRRTILLFTVVGVAVLLASGGGVLAQQASSTHTFLTK
jgi:hypothetical protein